MTNWRDEVEANIQKLIDRDVEAGKYYDLDKAKGNLIEINELSFDGITAVEYYVKDLKPRGAILAVPGFTANKWCFAILAERLALLGYYVLSTDIRGHWGMSDTEMRVGGVCDDVRRSVKFLEKRFDRIAIIGHSMGAIAASFAIAGYSEEIEKEVNTFWKDFLKLAEQIGENLEKTPETAIKDMATLNYQYEKLKEILKKGYDNAKPMQDHVKCIIPLSAVSSIKSFMPSKLIKRTVNLYSSVSKNSQEEVLKKFVKIYNDKFYVNKPKEELDRIKYEDEWKKNVAIIQGFATKDATAFLEYIADLNEPKDFIGIIKAFSKLPNGNASFARWYYQNFIKRMPKLFVYGYFDLGVNGFFTSLLGKRKYKLEEYYGDIGATKIIHGHFTHVYRKTKSILDLEKHGATVIFDKEERVKNFNTSQYKQYLEQHAEAKNVFKKKILEWQIKRHKKAFDQDISVTNEIYKFLKTYVG